MFYVLITYDGCSHWDDEPYTERRAEREVAAWKRRGCHAEAHPASPAVLAQIARQNVADRAA